ncbi:MAG: methionine synthase [Actinobacteria bacterium]|nr:methionine synthase [Actinomycetota bacterium]
MVDYPWPAGTATGIGSMPGTDPVEAARIVFGELPELPHQPELPARGPGADLIGRTAAMLVDIHVDLQPSGWRLVDRPGLDWRRARDMLARDLDALGEVAAGHTGHTEHTGPLKVQLAGVWTLAAGVELRRGNKAVADPGATRDLTQSLVEGARRYAAEVRSRVPGARLLVQWDEPSLPAVLAGRVPTASGYGTLRAIDGQVAGVALAAAFTAVPDAWPVVHCCAADAPVALLRSAGASGISLDAGLLPGEDTLGEAIEAGVALWLGVLPGTDPTGPLDPARLAEPVRALWRRLGFPAEQLARQVVVTPSCGLAGATPEYARRALRAVRETARVLADAPE